MQDNKITILSTGPLEKELVDKAFDLDVVIDTVPFISTSPVAPGELQKLIEPLSGQKTFVIVTSGNAVESLAGVVKTFPQGWRFFCIGYATKRALIKYFGDDCIAATADDGAALAEKIIKYTGTGELIFFCGDQRRDELPDRLREKGISVKEVIVYKTTATPQKLEKNYDGVLFFSPSAVKSFFSMNVLKPETILFTIGSTTAEALEAYTKNKIIIANKPEKEEVVDKAIKYFKQ